MHFFTSSLGRLRLIAILEAISYLGLLAFAMPMKYFYGDPSFVSRIGMYHGVLFVIFCAALLHALLDEALSFKWSVLIFCASFVPIVPFILDRKIANFSRAKSKSSSPNQPSQEAKS